MQVFHSQTKFSSEKTLPSSKTQPFTHFTTFYVNSKHIYSNLKTFPSSNFPWDSPTNSRLHFHFHPKLMKVISFFIEICVFMIQHVKFDLCIHLSNLIFFYQNFNFAHEIVYLACITSLWDLASNQLIVSQNTVIIYKTSQDSHLSLQVVSNTFRFRVISLWLFTFPNR